MLSASMKATESVAADATSDAEASCNHRVDRDSIRCSVMKILTATIIKSFFSYNFSKPHFYFHLFCQL